MTNRVKGEVPLKAGDRTYTLRFSANAICELEDQLDMGINQIAKQMADPEAMRMKTVIAVVWAGLRDHHPDITLAQAGEIITDASLIGSMEAVSEAFTVAFGEKEVDPTQPGRKRPEKTSPGRFVSTICILM